MARVRTKNSKKNSSRESSVDILSVSSEWDIVGQDENEDEVETGKLNISDQNEEAKINSESSQSGLDDTISNQSENTSVYSGSEESEFTSGIDTEYETEFETENDTEYENNTEYETDYEIKNNVYRKRSSKKPRVKKSKTFIDELTVFTKKHPNIKRAAHLALIFMTSIVLRGFLQDWFITLRYKYYDMVIDSKRVPIFGLPTHPIFVLKHNEKCNQVYQSYQTVLDDCYENTLNIDGCLIKYALLVDKDAAFCKWDVEHILSKQKSHLYYLSYAQSVKDFTDSSKKRVGHFMNDYLIGGTKQGFNFLSEKFTGEDLRKGKNVVVDSIGEFGNVLKKELDKGTKAIKNHDYEKDLELVKEKYEKAKEKVNIAGQVTYEGTKQALEHIEQINYKEKIEGAQKYLSNKFAAWF